MYQSREPESSRIPGLPAVREFELTAKLPLFSPFGLASGRSVIA